MTVGVGIRAKEVMFEGGEEGGYVTFSRPIIIHSKHFPDSDWLKAHV